MIVIMEGMGFKLGLQKSLTLLSNVYSSALQQIPSFSKYLPPNKINMHEITRGKGIQICSFFGSGKI